MTRKRRCGQGWLILAGGNQGAAIQIIRTKETAAFWLRRDSACRQCHTTNWWKDVIFRKMAGSA